MTMKLLSADDFRAAAKDGTKPEGTLFKFATAEPETVADAERTERFVFSDATVDHSKDSIDPDGWDLGIFKRNPVALFSHMSWEPPIGRASNVGIQAGQLIGDIEFATAEVYEFADTIYRLIKGKFLKAVSVGFMPKDWVWSTDKERPYGIDFKTQQLLEISVCPVPCNPNALGEARSLGIDTAPLAEWAEKVLDNGDTVFLPRKDLEALRSQSGAHETRYYLQASKPLPSAAAEKIRDAVKRWQNDPKEVLILADGVELRTIGEQPAEIAAPEVDEGAVAIVLADFCERGAISKEISDELSAALVAKAGRKMSAATKAKLQTAIEHHDAAMERHGEAAKCIKDLMDDDAEDEPDDDDQAVELAVPPVEVSDNMTPEERRVKEARALRESLPAID
jgi:HK97 family phage prohead protease